MDANLRDLIDQLQAKAAHVFKDVLDKDTVMPNEDVSPQVSNMIRVQRSLSWLQRASDLGGNDDPDIVFILSWIAFESLYGQVKKNVFEESASAIDKITGYLEELEKIEYDRKRLREVLAELLGEIKNLFANPYICNHAWNNYYDHHSRSGKFSNPFAREPWVVKQRDIKQVEQMNKILKELFTRLYLLRNQLFHGNATHKGVDKERASQINDGARVMQQLVPLFIWIMLDHMEHSPTSEKWGLIPYPRIKLNSI